jgi:hypothetical protein
MFSKNQDIWDTPVNEDRRPSHHASHMMLAIPCIAKFICCLRFTSATSFPVLLTLVELVGEGAGTVGAGGSGGGMFVATFPAVCSGVSFSSSSQRFVL